MRAKIPAIVLLFLALAAAVATPAAAGGWAMSTLDPGTERPTAGRDVPIGFTILQHGTTPVHPTDGEVGIRMVEVATGRSLVFPGVPQGPVGHFVATVHVPAAGAWRWEVMQGWFAPHSLGMIEVAAAPPAGPTAAAPQAASDGSGFDGWRVAVLVAAVGLVALAGADLLRTSRRRRGGRAAPVAAA